MKQGEEIDVLIPVFIHKLECQLSLSGAAEPGKNKEPSFRLRCVEEVDPHLLKDIFAAGEHPGWRWATSDAQTGLP